MNNLVRLAAVCGLAPLLSLVAPLSVAAQPASLVLSDAWVRAMPPGQPNTAAYLAVANTGAAAVTIIGASAAVAETVQIHTTREVDGYQRMEQLARLPLAPGQTLEFAPGGTHIMLMGLAAMPVEGDTVTICLHLDGGDEVCTDAGVRKSAAAGKSHEHHH